jgi:hypothetical protein
VEELPVGIRQRIDDETSHNSSMPLVKFSHFLVYLAFIFSALFIPWIAMFMALRYVPGERILLAILAFLVLCVAWLFCWGRFVAPLGKKILQYLAKKDPM